MYCAVDAEHISASIHIDGLSSVGVGMIADYLDHGKVACVSVVVDVGMDKNNTDDDNYLGYRTRHFLSLGRGIIYTILCRFFHLRI